jgi:hypothetical protein
MPEGRLHDLQVACSPVKLDGESVAQDVDGDGPIDPGVAAAAQAQWAR